MGGLVSLEEFAQRAHRVIQVLFLAISNEVKQEVKDDLTHVTLNSRIFEVKNLQKKCQQEAHKWAESVRLSDVNHTFF